MHCRLVLEACPYLHHLELCMNAYACLVPSHAAPFALLPRLRTHFLTQYQNYDIEQIIEAPHVDFDEILTCLN